ncbi:hypothetical protein PHMEG_0003491 [Phytophthora megakarya]|uniref:Uncharacterized protein n=1 Tax=Phytophthora megakarya TaxID=4795 RepID=A0A225WW67_9STRA|nr:hypothetical protein PHMEG_0003491 [Phytophthora megakarya]
MIPPGGVRCPLTIPVPTRWYSQYSCLKSVLINRHVLENLFCASRHNTIGCVGRLQYAVDLIDPIFEALGVLESDDAESSLVYERFRWLLRSSTDTSRKWSRDSILLDPHTDTLHYINSDESETIKKAYDFAERTNMF